MKNEAILYVPSDTPEAMIMATRKVAGVPMIVRGIMTLAHAGIESCTLLIAGTQREKIERFLGRYRVNQLPKIEIVHYEEQYFVDADMVRRIGGGEKSRCLLINANLLFERELIDAIRRIPPTDGSMTLCREGVHPLPIYDISSASWMSLEAFISTRPRSIESCIRYLIETSKTNTVSKPAETNTFLITHPRDRAVAEKSLAEAIRHRIDGPVARHINKRFSLPASLFMAKLWISPNTVTAINIIIGVFSGVFVADGHRYDIILLGAVLFQIASIVDGCDGEVAKLTFRCSKFGQYADTLCDNLSLGSFMTGLIAGYWRHTHSPVAFVVGAIMIFSTALTFFWMIRYLRKNTSSASLVTFDKKYLQKLDGPPTWFLSFIKYGKYALKKDVFSFAFLCFAVADVLYLCLFIAAFGTTAAAVVLTYLKLQEFWSKTRNRGFAGARIRSEGQSA